MFTLEQVVVMEVQFIDPGLSAEEAATLPRELGLDGRMGAATREAVQCSFPPNVPGSNNKSKGILVVYPPGTTI
jgi:hypothetical protein